jgi:hypothetical protein
MSTATSNRPAELAHRSNEGLDVYLFWDEPSGRVTVSVVDQRADESFEFDVEGGRALDAFSHPYAYASRSRWLHSAGGIDVLAA